jgi:PAS domain S-box-containing protein
MDLFTTITNPSNESQSLSPLLMSAFNASHTPTAILKLNGEIEFINKLFITLYKSNNIDFKSIDVFSWLQLSTEEINTISLLDINHTFTINKPLSTAINTVSNVAISFSLLLFQEEKFIFIQLQELPQNKEADNTNQLHNYIVQAILKYLPDAFYVKDKAGRKLMANDIDLKLMGNKKLSDVIGKTDKEIFNNEVGEIGYQDDMHLIQFGTSIINKTQNFFDENGKENWLLTSKVPFFNQEGKVEGIIGIGRDITSIKENEEKLQYAQFQLEKINAELIQKTEALANSNTDLERFAYTASHDLKAPLNNIEGLLNLLLAKSSEQLYAETEECVVLSLECVSKMKLLIEDILAYSKLSNTPINTSPVNLNDVVKDVLQNLDTHIKEKQAIIQVGKLPTLLSNQTLLLQLMQNLIGNALKYQPPYNTPIIKIGALIEQQKWTIVIEDNGIGISDENKSKVFELFNRLQTKEIYNGSGIGLSICKKIIERLNGNIWIENAINGGSVFKFHLNQ